LAVNLPPEHRKRFRLSYAEAAGEPLANVVDQVAKSLGAKPHLNFSTFMDAVGEHDKEDGVKLTSKR